MPEEITCLIVDDHEVVREGLRLSLSRAPHIRVIGEAGDGVSAVELAARRRPDVVIMDVRMPGMDGLEATKLLMQRLPDGKVLIFTAYSERSLLSRGLESGARGYILKEAPHETLVRAIEKVAHGETYVDPALMPAFLAGKDRDEMLTAREAGAASIWVNLLYLKPGTREHFLECVARDFPDQLERYESLYARRRAYLLAAEQEPVRRTVAELHAACPNWPSPEG